MLFYITLLCLVVLGPLSYVVVKSYGLEKKGEIGRWVAIMGFGLAFGCQYLKRYHPTVFDIENHPGMTLFVTLWWLALTLYSEFIIIYRLLKKRREIENRPPGK